VIHQAGHTWVVVPGPFSRTPTPCWHFTQYVSCAGSSQAELAEKELNLAETREYNRVLEFMEKRLQKQQVTFEGTLQAYEEALKFRRDELSDSARTLFEVRKEKLAEDQALLRYQVRTQAYAH
jgi:hypothetical protein